MPATQKSFWEFHSDGRLVRMRCRLSRSLLRGMAQLPVNLALLRLEPVEPEEETVPRSSTATVWHGALLRIRLLMAAWDVPASVEQTAMTHHPNGA